MAEGECVYSCVFVVCVMWSVCLSVRRPVLVREDEPSCSPVPALVVGSAAWAQSKATESLDVPSPNFDPFPSVPVLAGTCPAMHWKNVVTSWKGSKQAYMERYSVSGSMVYTGSQDLFAVAGNTLDLGGAVRCDGVTVLPPGGGWVCLALMCADQDPTRFLTPSGVEQVTLEGCMTDDRLDLVEEVRELLDMVKLGGGKVQRSSDLISAVTEVFSPWTPSADDIAESEGEYPCPQCDERFADKSSRKKHIKNACPSAGLKPKKKSEKDQKIPSSEAPTSSSSAAAHGKESGLSGDARKAPETTGMSKTKSRQFVCSALPLCSSSVKKRSFSTAEGLRKHLEVKHPSVSPAPTRPALASTDKTSMREGDCVEEMEDIVVGMSGLVLATMIPSSIGDDRNPPEPSESSSPVAVACPLCGVKKMKRFKGAVALRAHMADKHSVVYSGLGQPSL